MINYTTPTITLIVEGVNLTPYDVYVTIEQYNIEVTKSGSDLDVSMQTSSSGIDTVISFVLTKEESSRFFYNGNANVQVNWLDGETRGATEIKTIHVGKNLLDEVIGDEA